MKKRAVIDAARGLRDHLISVTSGYGTTFNGYGSGTNQYVCTTYVSKVLRNVGFPFEKGDAVDRNINIRGLDLGADPPTKLGELVRAGNEKTKGVVHALTIKKWGTEVTDLDTVQPGDCCQYWYVVIFNAQPHTRILRKLEHQRSNTGTARNRIKVTLSSSTL